MKDKYLRQRGLVYQDKIESLRIAIIGISPILLPFLLVQTFLNTGGFNGSIYLIGNGSDYKSILEGISQYNADINITLGLPSEKVDLLVLLDEEEIPDIRYSHLLSAQLTEDGFYIGNKMVKNDSRPNNLLTKSLAYMAAGMLAQEMIKLTECLRPTALVEQELQMKVLIRSKAVQKFFANGKNTPLGIKARYGNEAIRLIPTTTTGEGNEGEFLISIPPSAVTNAITSALQLVEEQASYEFRPTFFSLLGICELKGQTISNSRKLQIKSLKEFHTVVAGVGALGSWICTILTHSNIDKLQLSLLDMDDKVEIHNLNRQMLFTEKDIGSPKVYAAESKIKSIKPNALVHIYPMELKKNLIDDLKDNLEFNYQHPKLIDSSDGIDIESKMRAMLCHDLKQTDCVFAAIDSMYGRWLLNEISDSLKKPLINGGTDGLACVVDLLRSSKDLNLEQRYGEQIKTDKRSFSCDGGEVPIFSIVTSSVITASLQTLTALCIKAGLDLPSNMYRISDSNSSIFQMDLKSKK